MSEQTKEPSGLLTFREGAGKDEIDRATALKVEQHMSELHEQVTFLMNVVDGVRRECTLVLIHLWPTLSDEQKKPVRLFLKAMDITIQENVPEADLEDGWSKPKLELIKNKGGDETDEKEETK